MHSNYKLQNPFWILMIEIVFLFFIFDINNTFINLVFDNVKRVYVNRIDGKKINTYLQITFKYKYVMN